MTRLRIVTVALVATWMTLFALGPAATASPPPLFVYSGGHRFADGRPLTSPQTMDLEQITTNIPAIPELAGVVLMVTWSTLCPTDGHCDFSLIDKTIEYWHARGKRVVLSVPTNGFPVRVKSAAPDDIAGATPEWVMRQIKTYGFSSQMLGALPGEPDQVTQFPDFRDPKYLDLVAALVHELAARYDGNPTIAQIRIATGAMGEDNPIVGVPGHPWAGYAESQWLDFSRRVVQVYVAAFTRSELQFDITRLSYMWGHGAPAEQAAVDAFIHELFRHRVMLAFDGLSSDSSRLLAPGYDMRDSAARSLLFLKQYHERGGRTKLEAASLLSAPRMQAVAGIIDAVRRIEPEELVFFIDLALAGTHAPARSPLETTARQNGEQILRELGYR
jgi:glycosyl hydrolase family 42 (putative beta-galactosidase)